MSATAKFKQDKIVENTIQIKTENQQLDNIRHFYMQVKQRDKVECLQSLLKSQNFVRLSFSMPYQT